MIIGVLQFELLIHGAESLKDKRRVVRSLKDRLHREHLVSIAEVKSHDKPHVAVLGLAAVGHEGAAVGALLDRVLTKLRALTDAELGEVERRVVKADSTALGERVTSDPIEGSAADELARELAAWAGDADTGADAHGGHDERNEQAGHDARDGNRHAAPEAAPGPSRDGEARR